MIKGYLVEKKVGRKGEYEKWLTDDALIILQDWARQGLTDAQIAKNMGIAYVTLYDWKNRFPKFANALKKTKEIVDAEVENKLFKRAMGYEVEEEEVREIRNDDGEMVVVSRKKTKKHIPPDVTAIIFWLKNRRADTWREKQEVKFEGDEETKEQLKAITDAMAKIRESE